MSAASHQYRGDRLGRPILRVNIVDDDGTIRADVDAPSTADAMAYFLTSRRGADGEPLDPTATETSIKAAVEARWGRRMLDDEGITTEARNPIDATVVWRFNAWVH